MSTRLFLLRHGETQANIEQRYQGQGESHLSELGLEDAKAVSKTLLNEQFDAIYSSTLSRSNETAKIIAEPHKLSVTKIPELAERNYGDWEDMTFTDIKAKYGKLYEKWLVYPGLTVIPKAETLEDVQIRGVAAIDKLIEKHKDKTICVVGHGGINRTILFHYMNMDLNNFWRIRQDNCCINLIEFTDNHPIITLLNSTTFLGEKRIKKPVY